MSYTMSRCAPNGARSMDTLMDEFFGNARQQWAPPMDVSETENDLVVRVEVPGVEPKEIAVVFEKNTLTISGEKAAPEKEPKAEERAHRVERRYGRFVRQVEFNTMVDGDRVEAAFKNGVLTVTLPKHEKTRARTIDVKA